MNQLTKNGHDFLEIKGFENWRFQKMSTSKNGPLESYQGAMLPRLTSDQLDRPRYESWSRQEFLLLFLTKKSPEEIYKRSKPERTARVEFELLHFSH